MAKDSCIIIDEMTIPEKGAHRYSANQDFCMLSMFNSVERTTEQWAAIIDRAQLVLKKSWVYNENHEDTIMELVKKD